MLISPLESWQFDLYYFSIPPWQLAQSSVFQHLSFSNKMKSKVFFFNVVFLVYPSIKSLTKESMRMSNVLII